MTDDIQRKHSAAPLLNKIKWGMKYRLIFFGFLFSILMIAAIGVYALNTSKHSAELLEKGEKHFREAATAATEVSSYAKRAEGHLMLYLTLHRDTDKRKVPKRIASLHEQISILDHKILHHETIAILEKIKSLSHGIPADVNTLIAAHDKAMEKTGKFEIEKYQETILKLHHRFSGIRKWGVELAAREIKIENDEKTTIIADAMHLRHSMLISIICSAVFTLFLSCILYRMINTLNKEIVERKQIEKALLQSEERLRLALEGSGISFWEWLPETGDLNLDEQWVRNLAFEPGEIIFDFKWWKDSLHPQSKPVFEKALKDYLEGKKPRYELEYQIKTNTGEWKWIWMAGECVEYNDKREPVRLLGTHRDITEQKQLQNKVHEQEKVLRQAQKMESLGTLAGGIAHEFNNILGIIIGNTELALDDVPNWNPARDFLEEIRSASLRAREVIRQILRFVQKMPSEKKPTRISSVVRECLELMRATIPKTIEIRQELLCESEMIMVSPTEINHILMNLCTNSADAMEDADYGTIEVRLETVNLDDFSDGYYEGLSSGDYVKLTVKDTGSGIDPEILDRIFEPYFTTKDVDKGLGMGLAVVYGAVKNCNGSIRVKSRVGEGTLVEVLFPIIEAQTETKVGEPDYRSANSERILFVDDEASLVKMAKEMLERLGYQVIGKTNGREALELFQTDPDQFDLVITDMAMPKMAGDRFAQELIKIRSDIPIILYTGHSDHIDEDKAKELGIRAYTMKPLVKADLAKTVREVLDDL